MREKEIEEKFRTAVKQAGGNAYKFTSPGNDGVPDRLVVMPGGHIGFVEVKAPGRHPTPLQKMRIRELEKLGCRVLVLDRPEKIQEVIAAINRNGDPAVQDAKNADGRTGCLPGDGGGTHREVCSP